jgi:hypothetical protein
MSTQFFLKKKEYKCQQLRGLSIVSKIFFLKRLALLLRSTRIDRAWKNTVNVEMIQYFRGNFFILSVWVALLESLAPGFLEQCVPGGKDLDPLRAPLCNAHI